MSAEPTARDLAERLCNGMTSHWRTDRVRALVMLIKAEGSPLSREVFGWIGKGAWRSCFWCYLFSTTGNRVQLSAHTRRLLGWPAPPPYVSQRKRLAGVRALVARATNVYEVTTKGTPECSPRK